MKKGKHVLMHKPIANRLYEGRLVLKTARQAKVATHLLAYGSGTGNGLIAERIKEGVIGPLREVYNWRNPPVWPQYTEIPSDRPPVPKGFEWDLWLGPAVFRPYHPHYTHTVFRGWYDFGGGSMADMGIYSLWPVFTALNLSAPLSAEAWATHTCSIVDNVSRPVDNDFSYPTGCTLRFQFAARQDMPALDLFWYDGGMKPRLPDEIAEHGIQIDREGILFIGDEGAIKAGFNGQDPRLFAKGENKPLRMDENSPQGGSRSAAGRGDRQSSWLQAFKEGEPYAGDAVRTAIWTFATGGGYYFFHADAGQETVRTGIMGYDPYILGGDKGTYKRDWLGHASQFFNSCLDNLDAMAPHNELSSSGSYCLADPGREYVVYSMIGSPATVSVNLSATTGKTLNCRFYNPADGQFEPVFRRTGGSSHESFAKPDERDWVLHIVAK